MNGPDVVAEGCTHFPQLLVWEGKKKPEVGTGVGKRVKQELGKELSRITHKYGHICVGIFLAPVTTCLRPATVTYTNNNLQY